VWVVGVNRPPADPELETDWETDVPFGPVPGAIVSITVVRFRRWSDVQARQSPLSPPPSPRSPPPLDRVVTPPPLDPEEPCVLVRVVTGPLDADPLELGPAECVALVRVVTGALAGAPLPLTRCDPLALVVTPAVVPATTAPADPTACEALVRVRTAPTACPPVAPATNRVPPWRPPPWPACSCRTMWIVRRITTVLTSDAGLFDATVVAERGVERSAKPATPAASSAAMAPTVRVCVLCMGLGLRLSRSGPLFRSRVS
jgi:hypothetical protein